MAITIDKTRHVPRLGLSRAEVAASIGVCGNTVDQMVEEGFLPPPRRWHTRKVWLLSDIQAAMQAGAFCKSAKVCREACWRYQKCEC